MTTPGATPASVAPPPRSVHGPWFHRLALAATALALCVIVFGAFVRLSNAGLSCPDWPTCYGRATWPTQSEDLSAVNAAYPMRAVEPNKAWREQFHRHIAAVLGLLVLSLALLAARHRRHGVATVLSAAVLVAIAIPLYMGAHYLLASVLAAVGEALLLAAAWRWRGAVRGNGRGNGRGEGGSRDFAAVSTLLLAVIIVQALLGMWTVTWLLKPAVVMAHLLGGMATLSLLAWLGWRASGAVRLASTPSWRGLLLSGVALLLVQIALGGWTSANYAALACGTDFPRCLGQWWPPTAFGQGFVLWRGIGVDYEGGVLDGPARTAIHMAHRLFALVVVAHLAVLALRMWRSPGAAFVRGFAGALAALLLLQVSLGIANVVLGLPLWVATAHNAGAALLLFVLVSLLARLPARTR